MVFERKLVFDEVATLEKMVPGLKKAAGLSVVEIVRVDEESRGLAPQAESAMPGVPTFMFENVDE